MKLPYKLSHPKAKPPKFAHDADACFDLTAATREPINARSMLYDTGLVFDIPDGYHIKVYSRSGLGFKYDMRLCNSTGIIDADYLGTIKVKLVYDGPVSYRPDWPMVGDRIAQAMLVKNVKTELIEVEEITKETARGENGFGSTGK
jgi:dUTP pyrophosphatase